MLEFVFSVSLTERERERKRKREREINCLSNKYWDLVPFTLIFLKNKTQISKKKHKIKGKK
jgi:hypothetical protein